MGIEEDTLVSPNNGRKSQIPVEQTPFWRNATFFSVYHAASFYAIYFFITGNYMWQTIVLTMITFYIHMMGLTAGVHRLWSHRSFKAKLPLKLILLLGYTLAGQDSVIIWARDHRLHHKESDTDGDPHNPSRGFLFSHIGWLLCRRSDAVLKGLHKIDISDLESDPILMFQHKYYFSLCLSSVTILFWLIPVLFWDEDLFVSFAFLCLRVTFGLHVTFLINSLAHSSGYRPYDKTIRPADNIVVSICLLGEGWHNFHHAFPWDYAASELGVHQFNFVTAFIDFFAKIGWAYDLKTVSKSHIENRARRTGDGSRTPHGESHDSRGHRVHGNGKSGPWGWGDKDISENDKDCTQILYSQSKSTRLEG